MIKRHYVLEYDILAIDLSLWELLKWYFIAVAICFGLIGLYQEAYGKGTKLNLAIRHYFGLSEFVEYTATHPELLAFEDEVPICDYKTMTPKKFFVEHVSKYRPCLFKDYGKLWPAYGKWQNETYLKESAGDEIIYAER